MGWNQYIVNKASLTGIHQLELRLLSKMGYEVFVVNILFSLHIFLSYCVLSPFFTLFIY